MARSCWPWQNIRPPFPLQSLTDKSLSPKFYVEDHSNSSLSSRNTIDKLWWKRWNTKSSVRLAGEGKLSKKEKKKKKQTLQFYSYKNHRYMNTWIIRIYLFTYFYIIYLLLFGSHHSLNFFALNLVSRYETYWSLHLLLYVWCCSPVRPSARWSRKLRICLRALPYVEVSSKIRKTSIGGNKLISSIRKHSSDRKERLRQKNTNF